MSPQQWIMTGALVGALGVGLGAFGAHGLEKQLKKSGYTEEEVKDRAANYETAARYQMYHAPAIVLVGLLSLQRRSKAANIAGWHFLLGVLIFSGLLYVLVFAGDNYRWLGAIVPIGGTALIIGWVMLAVAGKMISDKS